MRVTGPGLLTAIGFPSELRGRAATDLSRAPRAGLDGGRLTFEIPAGTELLGPFHEIAVPIRVWDWAPATIFVKFGVDADPTRNAAGVNLFPDIDVRIDLPDFVKWTTGLIGLEEGISSGAGTMIGEWITFSAVDAELISLETFRSLRYSRRELTPSGVVGAGVRNDRQNAAMRVLVLGGTRFIGRALVAELLGAGHVVAVAHRGLHEAPDQGGVEHIHLERSALGEHRAELIRFRPDAAVDMSAMTAADAKAATQVLDRSVKLVVASSIDVYRACSSVAAGTVTDPVPLAEDAPLRDRPPPDRDVVPPGWDFDAARYEKLDVERIYLARGGVVCRLPMVYGERDYRRREEFVLRRVRARRARIPVGAGSFLCSRGYAPQLARGMRLAAERGAAGEVFNLAERRCAPVRLWAEAILRAANSEAELVRVPDERVPEDLGLTTAIAQHWLVDATEAGRRLGWVHAAWRDCVRNSVLWHLEHPPPAVGGQQDFAADDAALAAVA